MQVLSPGAIPVSFDPPRSLERNDRVTDRVLAFADGHRRLLFAGLVVLYVLGFNGQWRIERDSALYLTIGRNLAEGQGYTYHGQTHHLAFPGLPLIFAGIFRVFRTDRVFPALVAMWLMGFAVLGLTYRLFLLHAGRSTAVLMTVGLGMTRLFYRYCFELLSDLPFLLGVMAFLVGYEAVFFRRAVRPEGSESARADSPRARWFDWLFLVGGLAVAVATRPAMWVLLAAIVLAIFVRSIRGPVSWVQLVVALVVVGSALAFFFMDPRRQSSVAMDDYQEGLRIKLTTQLGPTLHMMFHENIPDLFESTIAKALFGCPIGPGMNTLAGLLVIGLSVWLLWHRVLWGLWAVLTLGMLLLFKPLDRYFLPVLPLLVFAWWRFLVWMNGKLPPRWGDLVVLTLFLAGIGTNLARLGEMVVEQRRMPFLAHYRDGRYASSLEVAKVVRYHTGKDDWVLVEPKVGRIMTYLSHRWAVEAAEQTQLDPTRQRVFALQGPSWEEGKAKAAPGPSEEVKTWLARRAYILGPSVGPPVQGPRDKEPWRLHRVFPKPQ